MADAGDIREEAERLVSAALAAASYALRGVGRDTPLAGLAERFLGHERTEREPGPGSAGFRGGKRIATGTPECCVCPVCRGIAAVRDPSPQFAFRVASGANDIASGIASILRAFQTAAPRPQPAPPRPRDPGPTWRAATDHPPAPADEDDPWRAATTAPVPPDDPPA
jgi:hypothetical protein